MASAASGCGELGLAPHLTGFYPAGHQGLSPLPRKPPPRPGSWRNRNLPPSLPPLCQAHNGRGHAFGEVVPTPEILSPRFFKSSPTAAIFCTATADWFACSSRLFNFSSVSMISLCKPSYCSCVVSLCQCLVCLFRSGFQGFQFFLRFPHRFRQEACASVPAVPCCRGPVSGDCSHPGAVTAWCVSPRLPLSERCQLCGVAADLHRNALYP